MNLDTTKWEYFRIGDVFKKRKVEKHSKIPEEAGEIPFVSSTSHNNGVSCFCNEDSIDGNCITVSTNGNCFDAFYQKDPFIASSDIEVLYSDYLNEYNALFVCTILKQESYRWCYGRKPKNNKVFDSIVRFPVNDQKEVDWDFMGRYIKQLHHKPLTTKVDKMIVDQTSVRYKEYLIEDLFTVKYGINMELINCTECGKDENNSVNFVSRTSENNGVVARVKIQDGYIPQKAGTITCAGGGSVLSTFVQTDDFYSGRDLYLLIPKMDMSIYTKLFICTVIEANKYRYNYGRQANKTLPYITLKLPAKSDGSPNFTYMENFIKSLPYSDRI